MLLYIGGASVLMEELRTLKLSSREKQAAEAGESLWVTRLGLYGIVLLGCGIMSVIGIWA